MSDSAPHPDGPGAVHSVQQAGPLSAAAALFNPAAPSPGPDPPQLAQNAPLLHEAAGSADPPCSAEESPPEVPRRQQPARGRRLARKADAPSPALTPAQRLLL